MSTHSILDDYLATILQLLQKYGWYLVGLIIIIMIARPYIIEWMNKIRYFLIYMYSYIFIFILLFYKHQFI
jgi:hypothetical protein